MLQISAYTKLSHGAEAADRRASQRTKGDRVSSPSDLLNIKCRSGAELDRPGSDAGSNAHFSDFSFSANASWQLELEPRSKLHRGKSHILRSLALLQVSGGLESVCH